jgi:hypothetical protein
MIIRDSSVPNLELEALIEMNASFVCSYLLFLYNRYEAICWLTWFVFHELDICTNSTKLNFQSVKNMSNLCWTFCYSCFAAIIQGYHLSNRSSCNLSFVCQVKIWVKIMTTIKSKIMSIRCQTFGSKDMRPKTTYDFLQWVFPIVPIQK